MLVFRFSAVNVFLLQCWLEYLLLFDAGPPLAGRDQPPRQRAVQLLELDAPLETQGYGRHMRTPSAIDKP
jgi:hypothetical protein